MSLALLFSLILLKCLPFTFSSCTTNTPLIFNFGDSNSDTGGFAAGLGLDLPYPYGRAFFPPPTGRASDGRLIIDFLCEYLGTHYLNPYLDSLEPDFTSGVNFAVIGACTLPKYEFRNLNVQISQFKRFYNHSLQLRSNGLTQWFGEEEFKNAVYTLDIGQNDLTGSFRSLAYDEVIERIPHFISKIKDAILAIYEVGGRNFWVHNTGPSGCLPIELVVNVSNKVSNDSGFDEYGCIKCVNEGAQVFNTKLNALCQQLRSQLENSTIVYVDIYSIKYDLIANSSSYGLENPLMACCGYGGPPYNYVPGRDCMFSGEHTVCEEGKRYVSWDGVHYTQAANAIVASQILTNRYSSPPLDFDFFCKNVASISSS